MTEAVCPRCNSQFNPYDTDGHRLYVCNVCRPQINHKVVPGDTIELEQDDGETIQVIVTCSGFFIKAPSVGAELDVSRESTICVKAKTVKTVRTIG